jgi:hypothetical protein
MRTRFAAYWAALSVVLVSVSLVRNWLLHPGESRWFVAGKAAVEAALVAVLAAFCPPLLIAFCTLWLCSFVWDHAALKTAASVAIGIVLSLLAGLYLEILLLVGVFSMNNITGEFVQNWRKLGGEDPATP